MLLLEAGVLGTFLALDLFLFFIFFEIVLVPMYFIIGGWGHGERVYAAVKFFLFTMAGSAFMLVGLLATVFLYRNETGILTFDVVQIASDQAIAASTTRWLFLAFAMAFAVKVPLFPLHTWLPDAHTNAPTAGSVILAGVMLKLGTYGFVRYGLYLFPDAAHWWAPLFITLGVIGIIYGAICATMQRDLKRLVAYSSVAHLGFIVLGTFALTTESISGGVIQMVNHGVSTGALFLLVGWIYERRHTRQIAELRGLQKVAPIFAACFTVVMLSSIGVPGLNGFVGEFLVLIGSFLTARWWVVVAATGVILAALYLLWAYQRVFHGQVDDANRHFPELSLKEGLVLLPLIGLIFFMGIYPEAGARTHRAERAASPRPRRGPLRLPPTDGGDERRGQRRMTALFAQVGSTFSGPTVDWFDITPLIVLAGGAVVLMLAGALVPIRWPKAVFASLTAAIGVAALVLTFILWHQVQDEGSTRLLGGAIVLDGPALFITVVICSAVVLTALFLEDYVEREGMASSEVFALLLTSALGGVVMAWASDLIVLFLGLEVLSLALYILAASHLRRIQSQEAGLKYFVLGGFSSAFFLYGIALTYGATGSTNMRQILTFLGHHAARGQGPAVHRHGADARRLRVQDLGRAVPHVDARRVRRARRHRSPGSWRRHRRRRPSPRCCGWCPSSSSTTATTGGR